MKIRQLINKLTEILDESGNINVLVGDFDVNCIQNGGNTVGNIEEIFITKNEKQKDSYIELVHYRDYE